ncbi:MAG: SDR family oxidoreductase [Ignavibacteria bacterium]
MRDWALILGSSSGFGAATSLALAREGINIVGVHLDRASALENVKKLIADIKSRGVDVKFFNVNAADANKRKEVLDSVEKGDFFLKDDKIKVMLHSLAFGTLKPYFGEKSEDDIKQQQLEMTIDVMGNSLVYWTQDIVRRGLMIKGGKIFAMTSSGGHRVIEYYGAVSAAKAVLESHCRQLAMELGSKGISVNPVLAGVTETPALSKIPNADKIITNALQRNPSHRLTTPQEVAEIIVAVTKLNNNWMNGGIIYADGGESAVEL